MISSHLSSNKSTKQTSFNSSIQQFQFSDPQYTDVEMFEKGNFKRRKRMRRPHHPYKASTFRSWPVAAAAAAISADPHLMIRGYSHFGYHTATPA